jgi:hypothetical protein
VFGPYESQEATVNAAHKMRRERALWTWTPEVLEPPEEARDVE